MGGTGKSGRDALHRFHHVHGLRMVTRRSFSLRTASTRLQVDQEEDVVSHEAVGRPHLGGEEVHPRHFAPANTEGGCQDEGRLDAGLTPCSFKTFAIVILAAWCPMFVSAPWIRRYPQPEFAFAICTSELPTLALHTW